MEHDFKVILQRKSGAPIEITGILSGITWSGDYQQVARKLDIDVLYAINDKNQPTVVPDLGENISIEVIRYR